MKPRQLVLPLVLILFGVVLLHGCIYIPTFNQHHSGIDAAKQVGDARSGRLLRIGSATRADVDRVLGRPTYVSADGSEIAHTWLVQSGVWLNICFGSSEILSKRAALLRFDSGGVLRGVRVVKQDGLSRWMREKAVLPPPPPPPAALPIPSSPPPGPRYDTPPSP